MFHSWNLIFQITLSEYSNLEKNDHYSNLRSRGKQLYTHLE